MATLSTDLSRKLPEAIDRAPPTDAREVLRYFQRSSSDVATVDQLERFVREHSESGPDETQVEMQLHHSTLPKLAETDLLDYDSGVTRPDSATAWRRTSDHAPSPGYRRRAATFSSAVSSLTSS